MLGRSTQILTSLWNKSCDLEIHQENLNQGMLEAVLWKLHVQHILQLIVIIPQCWKPLKATPQKNQTAKIEKQSEWHWSHEEHQWNVATSVMDAMLFHKEWSPNANLACYDKVLNVCECHRTWQLPYWDCNSWVMKSSWFKQNDVMFIITLYHTHMWRWWVMGLGFKNSHLHS